MVQERVRDLESEMHVMSARIPATRRAANHQSTSKPAKKKADQDAVTDAATPTAQAQVSPLLMLAIPLLDSAMQP